MKPNTILKRINIKGGYEMLNLSKDAKTLLKAAVSKKHGQLVKYTTIEGEFIQTGGQNFGGVMLEK